MTGLRIEFVGTDPSDDGAAAFRETGGKLTIVRCTSAVRRVLRVADLEAHFGVT